MGRQAKQIGTAAIVRLLDMNPSSYNKLAANLAFPWCAPLCGGWTAMALPLRLRRAGLAGHLLEAATHGRRVALDARQLLARQRTAVLLFLLLDVAGGPDDHGSSLGWITRWAGRVAWPAALRNLDRARRVAVGAPSKGAFGKHWHMGRAS
jgi:hypothetical protein